MGDVQIMNTIGYNSLIKGRKVVVYGTGNNSINCVNLLNDFCINIDFFTNSYTTSDEGSHLGIPLISYNKLNPTDYFVIISVLTDCRLEISEMLKIKGFVLLTDYINFNELRFPICDFEYHGCKIGKMTYGYQCFDPRIVENYFDSIGRYCSINIKSYANVNHPQFIAQGFQLYSKINSDVYNNSVIEKMKYKFSIGNDVWIGANTFINLSGCHYIGDGAVIGAGAVVIHDVPPYAVVVGVPARILKYRFSPEQIEILLRVKWWSRKEEWLRENKAIFEDMNLFFEHFKDYTPLDDTLDMQIV
jgi:acetyltransferase-like isoleucine patch superfamily enzyme